MTLGDLLEVSIWKLGLVVSGLLLLGVAFSEWISIDLPEPSEKFFDWRRDWEVLKLASSPLLTALFGLFAFFAAWIL